MPTHVILWLSIEPQIKRDGYHSRMLRRHVDLPMPPFVGMQIYLSDVCCTVRRVSYFVETNSLFADVESDSEQPRTEQGVDAVAKAYIDDGWNDEQGSRPLADARPAAPTR